MRLTSKKLIMVCLVILASLTLGCVQYQVQHQKNVDQVGGQVSWINQSDQALSNSTVANLLPANLMGMHKLVALKGESALEFVKHSHKGPIKYVKDIALVHYLGNNSIMLVWITEYPSAKICKNQTLLMVNGMKNFESVWKAVNETKLGNLKVYYVPGKNQYFFCKGKYMIYLIPVNMNRSVIENFALKVYSLLPK